MNNPIRTIMIDGSEFRIIESKALPSGLLALRGGGKTFVVNLETGKMVELKLQSLETGRWKIRYEA